jgi:arginine-tRNA-protein transferase
MLYIPLKQPLDPAFMDGLLAMGFYRMQQHVFTTSIVVLDADTWFQVKWVRVVLADYEPNNRYLKLQKLNKRFELVQTVAIIDDEVEQLYQRYLGGIDFDASSSVRSFLMDTHPYDYFPSRMWQVRDGDRLIACGYFDEGIQSAAGILNFYDPAYARYSPGLWLYLHNVHHAASTGKQFFYPGYIGIGYKKFDYKLLAGTHRMEVWLGEGAGWMPYDEWQLQEAE